MCATIYSSVYSSYTCIYLKITACNYEQNSLEHNTDVYAACIHLYNDLQHSADTYTACVRLVYMCIKVKNHEYSRE